MADSRLIRSLKHEQVQSFQPGRKRSWDFHPRVLPLMTPNEEDESTVSAPHHCEYRNGKADNAIIIMHSVRKSTTAWRLNVLKIVARNLIEYMHETHEGVRDMAFSTFFAMSKAFGELFAIKQTSEPEPFVDEILRMLPTATIDISPQQVYDFFEAVGYVVATVHNEAQQEVLLSQLMEIPNNAWETLMARLGRHTDTLDETDNVKALFNALKINVSVCASLGSHFHHQMRRIFRGLIGLYKAVTRMITELIDREGSIATRFPKCRALRTVKKEILRLLTTYIRKLEGVDVFGNNLVLPVLDTVLVDYNRLYPVARDSEVFILLTTMVMRLGNRLSIHIPAVMEEVVESTLYVMAGDAAVYPEHRDGLFKLLRVINLTCFPALIKLPPLQFKCYMDGILWGIGQGIKGLSDVCLSTCSEVVDNFVASDAAVADPFFQEYFIDIIKVVVGVVLNAEHQVGFNLKSRLLARLFQLVELEFIQIPISNQIHASDHSTFLRNYCTNLICDASDEVELDESEAFVSNLCRVCSDTSEFMSNLREFLVKLRTFSSDNGHLFLEDSEVEQRRQVDVDGSSFREGDDWFS